MKLQLKPVVRGLAVAFGGLSALTTLPALAQQQQLERVEITGSLIKRVEGETALPVSIIKAEDLDKAGVKTAEQAVQFIAQNQSLTNSSRSIGQTNGGAAYADLRAAGPERTLVLLNGQRVVKNPYSGVATDLNVIPTVAISRIEVLTDGASSIYGTDAIAGVINIITRRDYQGIEVGGSAKLPQGDGGEQYNGNITLGFGSLAKDGFNVFGGFSYTKENRIRAVDRDYASSGIIEDKGVYLTSGTSFPGNYSQSARGVATNPTLPGCAPPDSVLIAGIFGPNSCRFDYTRYIDIMSEVERWSLFGRGSLALGSHTASLEYFRAYNSVGNNVAPTPLTSLPMRSNNPYFPGGSAGVPITNTNLDPTLPISVGWRMIPGGPRASEIDNTTQRVLGEIEGPIGTNWNYKVSAHYSDSQVDNTFTNGYVSRQGIIDGLAGANGAPFLNPFGAPTAEQSAYIQSQKILGQVQDIKGKLYGINGTVSGDLMQLPAGPLGFAALASYSKEDIDFTNNFTLIRQAASSGLELAEDTSGSIRNYALAAEFNVPILRNAPFAKSLEVPISVRYDNYDQSGSTTNPKIGVRWQTMDNLLLRGSYNKGFRAPGVFDLFAPNSVTFTSNSYNDPVLCPNGVPVPGADPARDCGQQFRQLQGGSMSVEPEKSDSWAIGFVFDLARNASFSIDYFNSKVKGTIGALPETAIFGDTAGYADKFVRCSQLPPSQAAAIDACVPGPVDPLAYIVTTTANLGDIKSQGFDLALNASSDASSYGRFTFALNGTYLTKWEQQLVKDGDFYSALGKYSVELNFPAPRWQHVMQVGWETGAWSTTLFNRFKAGYDDYNLDTLDDDIYGHNTVGNWSVYDVTVSYTGVKGLTLTGGVLNLMDKRGPFTNQNATFQTGYDPRISDPVGRAWFLQARYKFM
jgi:iron complex outermembrane receptor protein